ncbi:efflux RND transporter periplasmic adaptor subunit [Desulfotomaculum sp. 1211_IL3151]|uniref:efflux RND transporter periplasmic adaptor subunit n=1 Tax=Desulfotomaculum sp. 1211_IL3151 TaxID=3084055 RepID=UPI002FD971CC
MKGKKRFFLGAGLVILMILSGLALSYGGIEVETVQIAKGEIRQTVEEIGYVQPSTEFNLYTTQSARVVKVPVKSGQAVTKDQPLVFLENLDLAAQLTDLHAQLAQAATAVNTAKVAQQRAQLVLQDAQGDLARSEELFNAGAATKVELEKAKLLVDTSNQNVEEANSQLESALVVHAGLNQSLQQLNAKEQQLVVKSPIKGTLLAIPAEQEQVLSQGALLATVAVAGQLEIKADILGDDLRDIKLGQNVVITAPVLGQKVLEGQVKEIYPRAEEKESALGITQRRVPVIITLPDASLLKPGYEVKAAIETDKRQNTVLVPIEAVRTTTDGQKQVMIVVNNRVKYRSIRTGISDKNNLQVIEGLAIGDIVIKDGSLDLKESAKVR